MNKALLALSVLILISLACGSSAPEVKTVEDYVNEYGGNADVYQRILSLSDCAQLQTEFDIAAQNNSSAAPGTANHKETLGYMTAADDRMKSLNCYSGSSSLEIPNTTNTQDPALPAPILTATIYFLPTLTKPVIPTPITIPGSDNTPIPSPTYVFIMPTQQQGSGGSTCSCSADTLNCENFNTHSEAQACYEYCIAQGAGDIHKLDQENDGLACEGLP